MHIKEKNKLLTKQSTEYQMATLELKSTIMQDWLYSNNENAIKKYLDFLEECDSYSPIRLIYGQLSILEYICQKFILTKRELLVCILRSFFTLDEIGKMFSLGKERIRQIEARAFRKLYHPSRVKEFEKILKENSEIEILNKRISELEKENIELRRHTEKDIDIVIEKSILGQKIEDQNFSVRLRNCLFCEGFIYIKDIIKYKRYEILRIKNLGSKSLMELQKFLNSHGLELKQDCA